MSIATATYACRTCFDTGIVALNIHPYDPTQPIEDQFAPCVCRAGDQHRQILGDWLNPAPCVRCGKPRTRKSRSATRCDDCDTAGARALEASLR